MILVVWRFRGPVYITKKIIELKKKTGKEVTSIQFTAREKMTGLESYDIKIDLI
ncbi:addiction module toxin, GnsA/GnsB family [Escherichia coli]|uniref:GnsA/GnsB family addiction module toxin n=1 Tax=Escherichia coli TaxID=562 RepID=UPI001302E659|nr:addiction module toxin, GnsA/GnsB family [Escherichia coli]KAE9718499.1 addiction module toxin, GnsA/GnsB family [Escherichia coli]